MFTISETFIFQVSEEKRCQTFSFIHLIIGVASQPGLVPISLSEEKFNQKAFIGQLFIICVWRQSQTQISAFTKSLFNSPSICNQFQAQIISFTLP